MSRSDFLSRYKELPLFPGTAFSHRAMTGPLDAKPESEDTRIRKEINATIRNGEKNGKSMEEIEGILYEKYPERKEYIMKMIKQYLNKAKGKER